MTAEIKIARKILRSGGVIFPLLYFLFNRQIALTVIFAIGLFFIVLEILRFRLPVLNNSRILKLFLKKEENKKVSGIVLFIISSYLTVLLFPRRIAIISLLFLIFGDMSAEIIGLKFGKIKILGEKTIEGSLSCFVICLIIGSFLMNTIGISFPLIIIGSLAATFIELVPLKIARMKINDNLSMALFTALIMTICI